MASTLEFVNYVVEQIKLDVPITYKKMFGEYLIYANAKPTVMVCDNTAFIKILDCIKPYLENAEKGFPYTGAKEHYIIDVDNSELMTNVVRELEKNVPVPQKKKKKNII
ncbi:MAG: transcriptional regulator [Spirochaetaceae bacterium]|jgi:TfoX/Sxy family transcriptional regulator of competence genes|nr:transcriptional regulator [Spirochaetaceae bacterium]